MNANDYSHFAAQLLILVSYTTFPIVLAVTVVGLAMSFLQAITQVQDQSLSLLPKLIVFSLAIFALSKWIALSVLAFTHNMFDLLSSVR